MLYAIIAMLVIILDQWVKYWVAGNISVGVGLKEFIPGIISLVNVHNDGAAFSFLSGSGARIYFIIICGVFTVGVIIALATNLISGPIGRWSAVMVVAGGLSNCIDRILYGYVQDMFKVELFDFAVFNVADIFITVFCFVFILYVLFGGEKKPEYDDEDDQYDEDDEESDAKPLFGRRKKADDGPAKRPVLGARAQHGGEQRGTPRGEARTGTARAPRKTKYEEEYEQFKAARAARQQAQGYTEETPAPRPVKQVDPADPFAEWERANARVEAQKNAYAAAAVGQSVERTPGNQRLAYSGREAAAEQSVQPRRAEPERQSALVRQRPAAPAQSAQPKPAAPAQRPVAADAAPAPIAPAKPIAESSDDDFSLDDILNEYK